MNLNSSYRNIFRISAPIMIGSASQNIIALTDSLLLYHYDQVMFAAMGFVGVYYLIIAAIGYGFSRGGQILIARKMGERSIKSIGQITHMMLLFELLIAVAMFFLMRHGSEFIFRHLAKSDLIIQHSLEYIKYRSWGVFFSYLGVVLIALYAGVARTSIIGYQTLILVLVNLILNFGFIFGNFGLPAMGIGGAALASTLAEGFAFIMFTIYIIIDHRKNNYSLFRWHPVEWKVIRNIIQVSVPFIIQSIVGLGSWFLLFSWIENMGERPLAISNLGRIAYLLLSIPVWGYASGIQTLVSGFIGKNKSQAVIPIIWKTARLSLITTCTLAIPFLVLPEILLYPILGADDMGLLQEAKPVFLVIIVLLAMFSVATIFFNGLGGTGASFHGLNIQIFCTLFYLLIAFYIIKVKNMGLVWAWGCEAIYWVMVLAFSVYALYGKKWKGIFD